MRTASVRSSAKEPSPEPRTSPIPGRSLVCESRNAAADSARVNKSGAIENHEGADAFVRPPSAARQLRTFSRTQQKPAPTATAPGHAHCDPVLLCSLNWGCRNREVRLHMGAHTVRLENRPTDSARK